jgi:PhoPQ-activated pathogenicity-related protein
MSLNNFYALNVLRKIPNVDSTQLLEIMDPFSTFSTGAVQGTRINSNCLSVLPDRLPFGSAL